MIGMIPAHAHKAQSPGSVMAWQEVYSNTNKNSEPEVIFQNRFFYFLFLFFTFNTLQNNVLYIFQFIVQIIYSTVASFYILWSCFCEF